MRMNGGDRDKNSVGKHVLVGLGPHVAFSVLPAERLAGQTAAPAAHNNHIVFDFHLGWLACWVYPTRLTVTRKREA